MSRGNATAPVLGKRVSALRTHPAIRRRMERGKTGDENADLSSPQPLRGCGRGRKGRPGRVHSDEATTATLKTARVGAPERRCFCFVVVQIPQVRFWKGAWTEGPTGTGSQQRSDDSDAKDSPSRSAGTSLPLLRRCSNPAGTLLERCVDGRTDRDGFTATKRRQRR